MVKVINIHMEDQTFLQHLASSRDHVDQGQDVKEDIIFVGNTSVYQAQLAVTPQTPQSWFSSAATQSPSCEKGRRRPHANVFDDEALLILILSWQRLGKYRRVGSLTGDKT